MSLRKGDSRKKAQKHQNHTAFKAGLHCQSGKKAKDAASIVLAGLCARCREKIEWKIKYDKYKPLSVPKKCILCQCKSVKQAYYQICRECSTTRDVCAKCGRKEDVVERFPQTAQEQARDEAEFRADLKKLTERERRSLLREHFSGDTGVKISKEGATVLHKPVDENSQDQDQYIDNGPYSEETSSNGEAGNEEITTKCNDCSAVIDSQ